jgi:uncharacterized protein (UPF0548 family)
VLGLRWLSNIEVRTRADYVNREYVNWWLLHRFLITCVPFTTIVVGRFAHFAPAIWLSRLAIGLSFVDSKVALWALAMNFAGPLLRRWSRRAEVSD